LAIPDAKSFWMIITETGCYALSNRRNPLT